MKARVVKEEKGDMVLLYQDGTKSKATPAVLNELFNKFKSIARSTGQDGRWDDEASDMVFYPGETLGYVSDRSELVLLSSTVYAACVDSAYLASSYVSTEEFGKLYGKTPEIIKLYCREGRISGARKVGRSWMIPKDAPYPARQDHFNSSSVSPLKKNIKK